MRLLRVLLLVIVFAQSLVGQNLYHRAYDANGEIGEKLFPEDENGKIKFQGIIECEHSSAEIKELIKEWMWLSENNSKIDFDDQLFGLRRVGFEAEIPVGKDYIAIGQGWSDDLIALIERHFSKVSFTGIIEVTDNKIRYTFFDFYTNRRMIKGEAKSEGQSNLIHWQRVNSLIKERDVLLNKKRLSSDDKEELAEKMASIEYENYIYKAEFVAVENFIKTLKDILKEDFNF